MGVEAIIAATAIADAGRYKTATLKCKVPAPSLRTEEKVKELFDELELPYDMTGVEILRDYLTSLDK